MSVNKQIILGRLGQNPEVRMTQSGQQVANLSVATSEVWTQNGEKKEKTEWHKVILWGKLAEVAGKYLKKGSQVYIEGRTETRSWEKDGQKHYVKEVVAQEMKLLGSPKQEGSQQEAQQGHSSQDSDSDVPF